MVTGALVTSGIEAALGRAHQDAVTSLYRAEGAIERFVADFDAPVDPGVYGAEHPDNPTDMSITVSQLMNRVDGDADEGDVRTVVASYRTEPPDGRGRSVTIVLKHVIPPSDCDECAAPSSSPTLLGWSEVVR